MSKEKLTDIKLNAAFAALGLAHARAARGKIYLRTSEMPAAYKVAIAVGARDHAETLALMMYGRASAHGAGRL